MDENVSSVSLWAINVHICVDVPHNNYLMLFAISLYSLIRKSIYRDYRNYFWLKALVAIFVSFDKSQNCVFVAGYVIAFQGFNGAAQKKVASDFL